MKRLFLSSLRPVSLVVVAVMICSVILQVCRFPAWDLLTNIVDGSFASIPACLNTLGWTMPLLISALGVVMSFRCGFFNIGVQGQFYVGSVGAAVVVEALSGAPAWFVIPLTILAGVIAGGVWAAWPWFLRTRYGTDEVITTLMGNFLAGLILLYVTAGPLKDSSGTGSSAVSKPVAQAYRIASSGGVSWTIVAITVAVVGAVWYATNRTAFGVLSQLAGRNPVMTRWQGARVGRLSFVSFVASGCLAGLSGAIELLGANGRLVSGFMPAHGFTAILIALVGGLSVVGAGIASLFFGGLAAASLYLPVVAGLPSAGIDVLNAVIAILITARLSRPAWIPSKRSSVLPNVVPAASVDASIHAKDPS